jgi:hypothetical protein
MDFFEKSSESPKGTIDVKTDWAAYNKDFDPENPEHFKAWLEMCPSHLTEGDWQLALGELSEMLDSETIKTEHDKSMLVLGWKSKYNLLPPEEKK